jgi:hypothetical protein
MFKQNRTEKRVSVHEHCDPPRNRQHLGDPASSRLRSAFPVWDGAMPQASESNEEDVMFKMLSANRRDLLIAPLLAAIPGALLGDRADASPIDPGFSAN